MDSFLYTVEYAGAPGARVQFGALAPWLYSKQGRGELVPGAAGILARHGLGAEPGLQTSSARQ